VRKSEIKSNDVNKKHRMKRKLRKVDPQKEKNEQRH